MATALAVVNKNLNIPGAKQPLQLTHSEMVAIWYRMRNAEYRTKIQAEMNYQLGGAGEMRTEKGWQQPEPHQIDWEKLANFLNDMYERIGLGRNTSAEALELEHINGQYR